MWLRDSNIGATSSVMYDSNGDLWNVVYYSSGVSPYLAIYKNNSMAFDNDYSVTFMKLGNFN